MDASRIPIENAANESESGQSIIEFLLLLPLMIGLTVLLIRINTTIQISIVNQQHARAHALWLAFNSPNYPEFRHRYTSATPNGYNQLIIGISENTSEDEGSAQYEPEASVHTIARTRRTAAGASDEKQTDDMPLRANVRVRNTIALCTPTHRVLVDGRPQPITTSLLREPLDPRAFEYCRSPFNE